MWFERKYSENYFYIVMYLYCVILCMKKIDKYKDRYKDCDLHYKLNMSV